MVNYSDKLKKIKFDSVVYWILIDKIKLSSVHGYKTSFWI